MFSLKADHVLLRVHVIVFKSEVNEEKWSQNFFLDKHHFVVLQRSSSQMTTHASKSKREEDKLPNRFSVNFYDFEKKNPPPLHSFSEKEMSSSLFTWWYYDEVMTSWRGNLLTLKSAANNHAQILFCILLKIVIGRESRHYIFGRGKDRKTTWYVSTECVFQMCWYARGIHISHKIS